MKIISEIREASQHCLKKCRLNCLQNFPGNAGKYPRKFFLLPPRRSIEITDDEQTMRRGIQSESNSSATHTMYICTTTTTTTHISITIWLLTDLAPLATSQPSLIHTPLSARQYHRPPLTTHVGEIEKQKIEKREERRNREDLLHSSHWYCQALS